MKCQCFHFCTVFPFCSIVLCFKWGLKNHWVPLLLIKSILHKYQQKVIFIFQGSSLTKQEVSLTQILWPFPLFNVTFGLKILKTPLYPQILLKGRTSLSKSKSEVTLMSKLSVKNLLKLFDSKFWLSSWWLPKMYSHRLLFIHIFVWVVFFSDFKL